MLGLPALLAGTHDLLELVESVGLLQDDCQEWLPGGVQPAFHFREVTASLMVGSETERTRSFSEQSIRVRCPLLLSTHSVTARTFSWAHWATMPADRSTATGPGFRSTPVPSLPIPRPMLVVIQETG